MARGKKTGGRDFQPGNPGRPKGARDKIPRGAIRRAYAEILDKNPDQFEQVIERGLDNPKTALGFLELAAKVFKEIGPGALPEMPVTTVVIRHMTCPECGYTEAETNSGKPRLQDRTSGANPDDSLESVQVPMRELNP